MKWSELITAVGAEPVFETGHLLVGPTDHADVARQLSRWVADGRLIRLRRGLYAFGGAEAQVRRAPHPFEIANRLVPGSYVSLNSVLARGGIIPEYVPVTTSITTGRPGRRVTPLDAFVYRHVRASMFWGFETEVLPGGARVYVATPEKALIDVLYLTDDAANSRYLDELRLQHLDRLRLDVLATMAAKTGSRRVVSAVEQIIGMAEAESAE
ncbi:MAG: type IV toxin-antitoxin system AbiEi family antitoxin domain-containing protein [Coriobacteriia bacterium]